MKFSGLVSSLQHLLDWPNLRESFFVQVDPEAVWKISRHQQIGVQRLPRHFVTEQFVPTHYFHLKRFLFEKVMQ